MTFISYAQNYEDVMLHRALKDVDRGFYIDVGANDPVTDSVTKAFYNAGWHGINIEPVSEWFEKLQQDRPDDINLQLAVGARKGKVNFYEVVGTGLSTMDESIAKQHAQEHGFELKKHKIPVVRLTTICEQHPHSDIHFLKIDVEGAELSVLKGLDLKKIRPWIILVESTLPNSQTENYEEWEHSLTDRKYHYVYFDGLNRYYVADEHDELDNAFIVPPNYFDFFKCASEDWLEHHAQWLKNEWDAAKTSLNQMEESVERVESTLLETKQQRQQLEMQVQTLQTSLTDSNVHQQEIETILQETKQQRNQLEIEVQTLQIDADRCDEQLCEKEKSINWLNSEWQAAKHQVDELHQSNHHWWLEADRVNKELQAIYGSKFWSITWPLRKLMQLFKRLFARPIRLTLWLFRLPKCSARWLIVKAMDFALRHPGLKDRAMAWLRKYPRLDTRLHLLAQARGLVATQSPPPPMSPQPETESAADLSHLTPSARRIYGELKTAMVQHEQESR